ncbi:MAG: hypothetical protein ACFFCE_01925 [Promethearchaeota archaeon]
MAKNSGYILVIIAGIIGLICLIAPVAYHSSIIGDSYVWMWGLSSFDPVIGDTDYHFSDNSDYLVWGLTATLLIVIATILLISSGVKAHKSNRSSGGLWIFCGLLLIAAPIIYYVGLLEVYSDWVVERFWDFYDFHFAFFGSFIAGALAIIGGAIK